MSKVIIKYGLILFGLLALLKFIEFQFFSYKLPLSSYLMIIASIFLIVGCAIAWFFKPDKIVEREVEIDQEKLAQLSEREQQMLLFLAQGYTNKEIALSLSISPNTVKTHLKSLFEKLDVSNRTQAVAEAKLLKLIH
ncbi:MULTISPECIES: helix-turn-helix domain-containing protein [Thalassotalea]|uniref:helix-turn-helix domain-containing protein n=1 Tax=Thalassotalea TaxID=1518149 RepID=UPI0009F86184|nr:MULTISPECIES: helix-turn-helix transcriptional regulator [Thalassotalea]